MSSTKVERRHLHQWYQQARVARDAVRASSDAVMVSVTPKQYSAAWRKWRYATSRYTYTMRKLRTLLDTPMFCTLPDVEESAASRGLQLRRSWE